MLYSSITGRTSYGPVGKARACLTTLTIITFFVLTMALWPGSAQSPMLPKAFPFTIWSPFNNAMFQTTMQSGFKRLFVQPEALQPLYQLNASDRLLYKRIFDAQQRQDWQQANALMRRVHDPVLIGHVLYSRYVTSPDYRASYKELRDWMVSYGDHPDAYRIYQLAQRRRMNNPATLPAPPIANKLFGALELKWFRHQDDVDNAPGAVVAVNDSDAAKTGQRVKAYLAAGNMDKALQFLSQGSSQKVLSPIESDSLLSEIAAKYYYAGKIATASKLAHRAVNRSGASVPVGNWVAGLTAWRQNDYAAAGPYFEAVAHSHIRNPWMLSAGAFWAARAAEKRHDSAAANDWLLEAANYDRTFYGMIANAALGDDVRNQLTSSHLTSVSIDNLRHIASGKRALALMDVGLADDAEKELMQIQPDGDRGVEKALVASAMQFNFKNLAQYLGVDFSKISRDEQAHYPLVPWKGDLSAGVNPALVNALIRQESQFDPNASNSRTGARGLMQLMPSTAEFVSDVSFNAKDLHKPEVNVALGQRYVRYLLDRPQVNGNLFYLAAAYNAGPGNLAKWRNNIDFDNDPLLFAESLPLSETRGFIQRVMTNYWIYSAHLKQNSETLNAVAVGQWPIYQSPKANLKLASF